MSTPHDRGDARNAGFVQDLRLHVGNGLLGAFQRRTHGHGEFEVELAMVNGRNEFPTDMGHQDVPAENKRQNGHHNDGEAVSSTPTGSRKDRPG